MKFPIVDLTTPSLGRAHWMWDDELEMHVPVCSRLKARGWYCFKGPLVGEQIAAGDCGEHDEKEESMVTEDRL